METRDKVLEFIGKTGPVLPSQISKLIGTDMILANAHLAELTASQKLKISAIKVGGSPLYYLPGQENMLQSFTSNMNDKEKKAYDLLQQSKVLRDAEQEPVIRVALREIKDFAMPLYVNYNNSKEIFWKWYLVSDQESELLIKQKLQIFEQPAQEIQQTIEKDEIKPEQKTKEPVQRDAKAKRERRAYKPRKEAEDDFLINITKFFEKNKINVVSSEVLKRNSEIDFIVEIPSVVGSLQYYCKARNKKRISDSDLSNAYVRGQLKRLPVLLLSQGELSAKAQELLNSELKNMTFKNIK